MATIARIVVPGATHTMSPNDLDTVNALRKHKETGRPMGDSRFIEEAEKILDVN